MLVLTHSDVLIVVSLSHTHNVVLGQCSILLSGVLTLFVYVHLFERTGKGVQAGRRGTRPPEERTGSRTNWLAQCIPATEIS